MKHKVVSIFTILLFGMVVGLMLISATTKVVAASTPYYTYTTDNEDGWIRTSDAYTPGATISEIDGVGFKTLEYVFVDKEDYVYVTDSGQAKVFIFDKDLNYVDEISYKESSTGALDGFYAVNSIYVSDDKIYVPDSFRKSIFIFDRNETLHRQQQYYLWMDDVDGSDSFTTGDLMYAADPDTQEPIGSPIYTIEVTGQNTQGHDIINFNDINTGETVFTKIDVEEMIGKLFGWTTTDFGGKTLLKTTIYKEKNIPIQTITTPNAPVFQEGYTFAPKRLVVDKRGNMYIVGAQSDNGLIMLNSDGEFLTFFGGNPLRTPLIDQIRSLLLTDVQKDKLREQSNIYIDYVSSVAIDQKGFIYTVTSTLDDNNIKKFNVSGKNYFNSGAPGWVGAVDLWVGNYGNVLTVEDFGWINEYNASGELVFSFSVADRGIDRDGLLSQPKSIAVDSHDDLYVVDQGNKLLQVYEPTPFTNAVHKAFQAYQDGDELLAQEMWEYSLQYATVFDFAHVGLGDSLVRQDDYAGALREYRIASDNEGISNTYWQVRQDWLEQNLDMVILGLLVLMVLRWIWKALNKKYHYTKGLEDGYQRLRERNKLIDELSYIPTFIKHPLNGYYEIKRHHRVSAKTAGVIYFLLALLYIMYQKVTNVIFLNDPNANVIYQLVILTFILGLWVIANYFVCLIRDGEGSFKNVFVATAMSFTPLLFVVPVVTLMSNVLTYQESVFYSVPLTFTFIWVAIYFFFMIKEIHNYEVNETVRVIFVSMFTMLIMGIFIFVIYSLNTQIFRVTVEISRELLER